MRDLTALRAEVANRRRALEPGEVAAASHAVADRIGAVLADRAPDRVGASFSRDGEVDAHPALVALRAAGWTSWYPVIDAGPPAAMSFRRWDTDDEPPAGRYDIPTPPPTSPECAAPELAVVLVPLVLFGPAGARAGRGAGYYDRTFAWLRDEARPTTPLLIGLGHDFQEVSDLAPKPWDVALDLVVTPTRTIRI